MCIFCGGTCGGSGDTLMPLLAAGAGIAVLKVRAVRVARKKKNAAGTEDNVPELEPATEDSQIES